MLANVAPGRQILRPVIGALTKKSARAHNMWTRVVSGPPQVRISFPEKVAHGIVMFVGMSAVPAYITAQIPKYNLEHSSEDADD